MDPDQVPRTEPENKDYLLKIEYHEDYLEARISGQRTRAAVSALTEAIARTSIEVHCSKILVDVQELEGHLTVFDSYHVVTQDFTKLRGRGIQKGAAVDREVPGLRGWFIETAALNRGFNFRVFADRKPALEWLLGKAQLEQGGDLNGNNLH